MSVVLPVLDEADGIGLTLARVAAFDEVVVADGGSTDATVARARDGATRVVVAPRGRARQMNHGARAATGQTLVFLHADTRMPPGARDLVVAVAARPGFVWGRFDVRIEGRSRWLPIVAWMMNHRSRLTGVATGDQTIFVARPAFEAIGGFPDIPLMEDVALSKALRRLAPPVCISAPVVTSGRRWDENGAPRTIATMLALRLGYWLGVPPARLARIYGRLKRG